MKLSLEIRSVHVKTDKTLKRKICQRLFTAETFIISTTFKWKTHLNNNQLLGKKKIEKNTWRRLEPKTNDTAALFNQKEKQQMKSMHSKSKEQTNKKKSIN